MKRFLRSSISLVLVCVVAVALFLTACSPEDTNTQSDLEQVTSTETKYLYLVEDSKDNYIVVKLPTNYDLDSKTNKLIADFITTKINEFSGEEFKLIGASALPEQKNLQDSEYYIEIETEVTYNTSDTVSIVFSGLFNKKGAAHPTNLFYALNFDPNTMQEIDFANRYTVDGELYTSFAQSGKEKITQLLGGTWPDAWKSFSEEFCSEQEFFEGIKLNTQGDAVYWYYSKTGIVFSFSVAHALGDHIEAEVSFDKLKKL